MQILFYCIEENDFGSLFCSLRMEVVLKIIEVAKDSNVIHPFSFSHDPLDYETTKTERRNLIHYNNLRKLWNEMVDCFPLCIVQPRTANALQPILHFLSTNNIETTIKGGGHNVAGLALKTGAVQIDLSLLNNVELDLHVKVGGGSKWRTVDALTSRTLCNQIQQSRYVPAGLISHTGVGGLALGGGLGWLSRTCGLTVDSLEEAELWLANGKRVVANDENNAELLWALRGGGGNFGVVSCFRFRTHLIPYVHCIVASYSIGSLMNDIKVGNEHATSGRETLQRFFTVYFEHAITASKQSTIYLFALNSSISLMHVIVPPLLRSEKGDEIVDEQTMNQLISDSTHHFTNDYPIQLSNELISNQMPLSELNSTYDQANQGHPIYWSKSTLFAPEQTNQNNELNHSFDQPFNRFIDLLIDVLIASTEGARSPTIEIVHVGGEINRISPTETAYFNRGFHFEVHSIVTLPNLIELCYLNE